MKNFVNKIADNGTQIIEVILLVLCGLAPILLNTAGLLAGYQVNTSPNLENIIVYLVVRAGNAAMSIALCLLVLWRIRAHNKDFLMNRSNVYHKYVYGWYWFCAKVLGIQKCNLERVPIYMQFKLVIRGTFADYPLDESAYPVVENESDVSISTINLEVCDKEINLILEDTYLVDSQQIPKTKRGLRTIKISRNDGKDKGRYFSQKYIEAVINAVRNLDQDSVVNIFATTNPMNTKHIASRTFALADRGNVQHLYVYQQNNFGNRVFEEKGYIVF